MGYRELLKNYIRFLELHAGDNFIESIPDAPEPVLTERDLGELRAIAAEIFREAHSSLPRTPVANYNYRFRLLLNHYGIAIRTAAAIAGASEECVRRWRTQPRSRRYLAMTREAFETFEARLAVYLETGRVPDPPNPPNPPEPDKRRSKRRGCQDTATKSSSRRGAAASNPS